MRAIALCLLAACAAPGADLDRDGLDDAFEQALLERFRPSFLVSDRECDSLPAQFAAHETRPRAVRKDGTIYGRAFPRPLPGAAGAVELHYFHLWSRDCGRGGHALDIEHVSALTAPGQGEGAWGFTALYWHAAAHQDTMCDAAHGARADALGAAGKGAVVWISHGKHASYLSLEACNAGCGSDRCAGVRMVPATPLINIGERAAPLNGAVWTGSKKWPFAAKFQTDFPDSILPRLDAAEGSELVLFSPALRPAHAFVLGGNSAISGLAAGERRTGAALDAASRSTENAIGRGAGAAGRSLERGRKKMVELLGVRAN